MLTTDRVAVLAAAARPTARAVSWSTASSILALAWLPLIWTMARNGSELGGAYGFAAVVGSGVLALAVDDEIVELAAPSPVPLVQRRGLRLAELLAAFLAVGAVAVAVGASRDRSVVASLDERAPVVAAVAAIALALASLVASRRLPGAGVAGALTAALGVGVVTGLAQRYTWLPTVLSERHHERWWFVAATGIVVTGRSWRDPAARATRSS